MFNAAVDWVVQRTMNVYPFSTDYYITDLKFVDELISLGVGDLATSQTVLEWDNEYISKINLKINTTQTKVFVGPDIHANRALQLND